jgi:hypothetical protein
MTLFLLMERLLRKLHSMHEPVGDSPVGKFRPWAADKGWLRSDQWVVEGWGEICVKMRSYFEHTLF